MDEQQPEIEKWKRRFQKERTAKKEAERLLEEKSLALYSVQKDLEEKLAALSAAEEELQQNIEELNAANEDRKTAMEKLEALNHNLEGNVAERTSELQKERTKILSSINYAKRIQDSIFPDEAYLKNKIADSFLLNIPRNIVSGDFPFVYEKEDILLLAVADCTGHGVPGALMSFVGYQAMTGALSSPFLLHPGLFLNYLDLYVNKLLNQEENQMRDGMDMALCCIDLKKRKLYYAGAKRPLFVVENGEGRLIKPTRHNIGGQLAEGGKTFETHAFNLREGMSFFMFSDGLPDQFGGPHNKKMMQKNLCRFLEKKADLPVDERKAKLKELFLRWKGDQRQIDDILIMNFAF